MQNANAILWIAGLLLVGFFAWGQEERRYEFRHQQMGAEFRLVFYAPDDSLAAKAARIAFTRIDELNERLSDYRADSEISRLSRVGPDSMVEVSPDLWAVLVQGQELAARSKGAFDLTIGPLSKLWRRAFRQRQFPDRERLKAARSLVGYRQLALLPARRSIRLTRAGLQLDAGGIAKGYAVDQAMEALNRLGIRRALVDGGGDLLAGEPPPGAEGWRIQAPAPDGAGEIVLLKNAALATSGDTYRYLEWQGKRYAHLIDPRTGRGVTHRAMVTVRCPTASLADGLATAVSIIGPRGNWRSMLKQYPACQVQLLFPGKKGYIRAGSINGSN